MTATGQDQSFTSLLAYDGFGLKAPKRPMRVNVNLARSALESRQSPGGPKTVIPLKLDDVRYERI